jgi:hypothetical protein
MECINSSWWKESVSHIVWSGRAASIDVQCTHVWRRENSSENPVEMQTSNEWSKPLPPRIFQLFLNGVNASSYTVAGFYPSSVPLGTSALNFSWTVES